MTVEIDPTGSATSPAGYRAGAAFAGIKTYGAGKLDIGILVSDEPAAAAAVFTRNRLRSACVDVNQERLAGGRGQAVVVNSGNANASTGERGLRDAYRMSEMAAEKAGLPPEAMFVCSTGVIGHHLPMDKIEAGVDAIDLAGNAGSDFARAIMTTDLVPKHCSVRFGPYTLGGCAKGSGMIHPNMATMLAYLTTDAPIDQGTLQAALSESTDRSFNLITVDGDTSPSDTVLLFANGAAGGETIAPGAEHYDAFREALDAVCIHLAKAIARDGEGATRLIEITVSGAATDADARSLVREIGTSPLVKTAVHGADPNWGRIVGVIGRSQAEILEEAVTVTVCGHRLFERTVPIPYDEATVSRAMSGEEVTIEVDLGAGESSATGWTCDLTADYIRINADYTT
ncbi:MAG: bifunctional glutamate N-acetyltransferase/amino-acid acetyltransferase ArgJ [Dehalococcoidia bacterium]|nr:bifunctional glutamate N-acetyltransferase/amino-acid acetyltransferase ArgJ [Dehalococcoidia bacterium]MYI85194.1 bifunctional glutamate N-acetyltransferase/amino-acid acetyltransferase ArgJ [Dehalococcoidia bacterium]